MRKAAFALIAVTALRIAATWTTFSATVDEPMHVSAGLQLYTQHVYTYQRENPPLGRIVLAFAPWLGGMDFDPDRPVDQQLLRVFYSDDRYKTNLVLARAGNLFFFVAASLAVWAWARRLLGEGGAFFATLVFTLQPMIVGHAGLATLDMAATAGVAYSLMLFARWLDGQTVRNAALFGLGYGVAVLCKFSCIGYVPAACLAMYLVRREFHGRAIAPSFFSALAVAALTVWIGYAFTVQPLIDGIRGLIAIDRAGHPGYLFGEVSWHGWWGYFPVATALKTTLASLALVLMARRRGWEAVAAAGAILLVSMTSHLDLGVRYVLPLYAPLAVAASSAVVALRRKWVVTALLMWHCLASIATHPDNFAYFNETVAREPWRYLADSNIDWGQDVLRLKRVVRQKKIDRLGVAILGWHDWDALGFPPHYDLQGDVPAHGWVAVSEHLLVLARRVPWLDGRPYERVGRSIRLYYLP